MNTTPSKTTDLSKTDTPADDPAKSTAETAVTEDTTATATPSEPTAATETEAADDAEAFDEAEDDDLEPDPFTEARHGVGAGATAVVSAALGIVALTGAWSGRVAAERETLMGQIQTAGGSSAAQQISEIYGDAWHTTALVNGLFAVLALLVGVFVLVRPAFGAPATRPQPAWIRAVALAGVALGTLGVLISVGMYFDLFLSLPVAGTPAG
ncbi:MULTISPECIES: hypothetical protein [unclassified Streptomyces]|uniref:hypothetical protein n=1 Tax=unclassified Streptomyces TaxID=2593676 RepID=UPI00081E1E9B|nr:MULTISPECIES: hypothetical protein [unclassified Streptomyces]MYR96348.1 hypothetical protein [Streptomyces sp. SID4937]SCE07862.1 hypothetical protein GA0115243_1062100 [Streptomyces sp. ScaeMP-e83]